MVLVTGCAGFIAYHVIKELLYDGVRVIGVDNLNDYYDVNIKKERLDMLKHKNFVFHQIDIENYSDMENIFKTYEFYKIVHLAGRAGVRNSLEEPQEYVNTNITGTLNILELMKKHNKKQMTFGSTSSLYADQTTPFKENDNNHPISPYAATKGAAELMCYVYSYLYKMNITVFRFFTVYGKYGRPDMSYDIFINAIKDGKRLTINGNGEQRRDFTYVEDIASAIMLSFDTQGYNLYNLGTGDTTSINELVAKIELLVGKKADVHYTKQHMADMQETKADNGKAFLELSWSPEHDINQGLKKTIG